MNWSWWIDIGPINTFKVPTKGLDHEENTESRSEIKTGNREPTKRTVKKNLNYKILFSNLTYNIGLIRFLDFEKQRNQFGFALGTIRTGKTKNRTDFRSNAFVLSLNPNRLRVHRP